MNIVKTLLCSAAILLASSFAGAQEKSGKKLAFVDKFFGPSMELDPEAIYQPEPRWTVALTGNVHQVGFAIENRFSVMSAYFDGYKVIEETSPGVVSMGLPRKVDQAAGIQLGYGKLSLSLNRQFHSDGTERSLSLDLMSAGYAVQLHYINHSDFLNYDFTIGEPDSWAYNATQGGTENPGRIRSLVLDAFYAFNRRSFAYSAAYKGNMFQRRSAGSFIFGTKLILNDFTLEKDENIVGWNGGIARQSNSQVSFGLGYSHNFVFLHRQPYADKEKGLRNLTLNLTAVPMVTLFNQFTSTAYAYSLETEQYEQYYKGYMNGTLRANFLTRIGIGYSHDLWTFNLSSTADAYSYYGNTDLPLGDGGRVDTDGHFYRWVVALRIGKRF